MNEIEISNYLLADKFTQKYFKGVLSFDELELKKKVLSGLYIINTDVSTGKGLHWVCLFIGKVYEYFDSLGQKPEEVMNFMSKQNKPYIYSSKRIQGYGTNVCGDYCIMFSYYRCRGVSLECFVKMFTDDYAQNDFIIKI